jgi:hypothetical protein
MTTQVGLDVTLTSFSPGTTIQSSQMNNNFSAIVGAAINNDAGTITTDLAGTLTTIGLITQQLNSSPNVVTVNGTTNGTAQLYQILWGTFKLVVLFFNNYQNNSSTEQTISIPQPFTAKAFCIAGNTKVMTPYSNGTALSNCVRQITGLAASGGSVTIQNGITSEGLASITAPFDAIGLGSGEATTANDIAVFFGI